MVYYSSDKCKITLFFHSSTLMSSHVENFSRTKKVVEALCVLYYYSSDYTTLCCFLSSVKSWPPAPDNGKAQKTANGLNLLVQVYKDFFKLGGLEG